ncbi:MULTISPECIES: general stress protein CsbD [unclassified Micromonospora]|uniref:general stress protein CsbD n=1 Tax=unclassified Micromonospora TaxID=2617518 RepID=UPI002FF0A023
MSVEKAKDQVEKLSGPARASMGNMNQDERTEAERVRQRDTLRGHPAGEHVQEDARDVPDDFTR